MPLVEGTEAGGLPITSYFLEVSSDQISWQELSGLTEDYSLTYFTDDSLTTGDRLYYRYSVKNLAGWSEPSDVTETMVGTEPS
jgi:hypothetical protein